MQVFDSGGELNDSPPTMFHPKRSPLPMQQQYQPVARAAPTPGPHHSDDAVVSASPALPLHSAANTAQQSPSPSHSAAPAPSTILPVSSTSSPENPLNRPPHHRVTHMQLVRSSGNITVTSAVPAVSNSVSSRTDPAQSAASTPAHIAAPSAAAAVVPAPVASAPDAAAALADQLMAKMQVGFVFLWTFAYIPLMSNLLQLEFNARLEAEREMFTKQMMTMQQQMQQQQVQQQQQFELMLKVR